MAFRSCILLHVLLEASARPKTPTVQWGQKPERLYVTIPLKEVTEPEVELEDVRRTVQVYIDFSHPSGGAELVGANNTQEAHELVAARLPAAQEERIYFRGISQGQEYEAESSRVRQS
ncbi:Hypothetical protein (Fragment) [Durusdinium trenchii]|uniref:Uncharacterized protein n=1 Tax=Durusdinium trenchii TaxID=1381693 RepID=A0ABP0HKW0_9DINO